MNKFLYFWNWIVIFFVMYCVLTVPLIIYVILVLPKIYWLVEIGISPIALVSSVFGAFVISAILAFKVGEFFGLKEQLGLLEEYLGSKKKKAKKGAKENE